MDNFFLELKSARESQNISLAEISNTTLIDVKMLEAIEEGNVHVLPQAYVRAFLREYANIVGLNPDETMKKYDSWIGSRDIAGSGSQRAPKISLPATREQAHIGEKKTLPAPTDTFTPALFKIVSVLVVLLVIDIVLWRVLKKEPSTAVQETSFKDVVKENEARAGLIDTSKQLIPAVPVQTGVDSLSLVATTTDSVWLLVAIDENPPVQYFLYPQTTTMWRAKNNFRLPVIGNPLHIKLSLNGTPLRVPTTDKDRAKDLVYSRDSLRRKAENAKRPR